MAKFSEKKRNKSEKKEVRKDNLTNLNFTLNYKEKLPFILSGIYLIVMLIISFSYHKIGDYGVETDFYEGMVWEAKELLKGNLIIEGYKGPLYPIVLAFFSLFSKDFFSIGILICLISGALFLLFSYKIIEKSFSYQIALLSVLLISINSVFIQYSYSAGTDLFFCFLSAISIYFLLKENDLNKLNLFLSGLFASLAYLTRTNGLFLPAALFVFLIIFFKQLGGIKKRVIGYAYYLTGFVILNIPWSIYKFIHKGSFFYDQNFKNTAWALYGEGKYSWDYFNAVEAPKFNSMADVFLRDPLHFISQIFFVNFYKNFSGDLEKLLSLPMAVLVVIGTIFLFLRKYDIKQKLLFVNLIFAFLVLLPAFYSERFSLFLLLGYSLIGVLFIYHDKIKNINNGNISLLIFIVVFVWTLSNSYKVNSEQIDRGPTEVLEMAAKVPNEIKNDSNLVVARKPHIGYYLNMDYRKIPFVTTYDSLVAWLRSKDAEYFYVSSFEAQTLMSYTKNQLEQQKFYSLIDPEIPKREFKIIAHTIDPPSVLYQVLK